VARCVGGCGYKAKKESEEQTVTESLRDGKSMLVLVRKKKRKDVAGREKMRNEKKTETKEKAKGNRRRNKKRYKIKE
jgi:hypothetical protein